MHRTIILHKTLHRISHALHLASFHHSVAVITPTGNSTSHYHVSHSIRHHPSVHHHFLHLATCHISHNTTTTYQSRRITHSLIPHRATFHISCHSTRTSPYYTTTFHNPLPVWETISYSLSLLKLEGDYGKLWHFMTVIHKVPEKLIPVCPNTTICFECHNGAYKLRPLKRTCCARWKRLGAAFHLVIFSSPTVSVSGRHASRSHAQTVEPSASGLGWYD